ncbi:cupin domain-containing protein [Alkalilimnicola ehrlichii]|uniref:Cupin n=1 Tax=Alkalilimnicola ehrlichii TaxID=351052 RepID=A0A3E0WT56_9GAMM|nr:cupin domain-containing protein [Alkalilimnicola ehrlichii]RFA36160.1 cupin [Alkalilimnicola ehrlichii]
MRADNLFANAAIPNEGERFDTLLSHKNLVVERIVSSEFIISETSIQKQDEWVVLLQGEALLDVAGESVSLMAGDYVFLPADVPHTLVRVSQGAVWLAVHLHPE